MAKLNRDDFSKKVITALAGRVTYLCSNPFCRRGTIGPNSIPDRTTLIGIAAHITAAAPGGPRYDNALTDIQRKDISNGIWLCSNCSILIDKDSKAFTVDTLKEWRTKAEIYAARQIGNENVSIYSSRPKIEVALLWQRGMSSNLGLIDRPGPDGIIRIESAKFLFENTRAYQLQLINNSSITAVNLKIQQSGGITLSIKDEVAPVNNLMPFKERSIYCELVTSYIMTGSERASHEDDTRGGYPKELSEVQLLLNYTDEHGQKFQTLTSFNGKQPNNIFN